jgi:ribosome-associated protein
MPSLKITPTIAIDESELDERFVQASGPGGQNVNKVATAVQLRFDVADSPALSEPVRQRLRALAGRRMTADGVLVIDARRFRTQERNRMDARQRLIELIRGAAMPAKKRIATRPTLAGRRRRLDAKKIRSATKRARLRPLIDD